MIVRRHLWPIHALITRDDNHQTEASECEEDAK
jgi:hypothetical protein